MLELDPSEREPLPLEVAVRLCVGEADQLPVSLIVPVAVTAAERVELALPVSLLVPVVLTEPVVLTVLE